MLFISPKWKITVLEMSLKSSIMSKLDHQMSKIWKKVASSFCKVLVNLTGWKTEYLIAQLRKGIWRKVVRLKRYPQGEQLYPSGPGRSGTVVVPLPVLGQMGSQDTIVRFLFAVISCSLSLKTRYACCTLTSYIKGLRGFWGCWETFIKCFYFHNSTLSCLFWPPRGVFGL